MAHLSSDENRPKHTNCLKKFGVIYNMKKYDFSNEHKLYLRRQTKHNILIHLCRIALLVIFLGLWQLLTDVGVLDVFFFSSPIRIVKKIGELYTTGELFYNIWVTLSETILAFIIATVLGFIFAGLLWQSNFVRKMLEPYIVVLNSLPKIALGPIIIIWMGIGQKAIVTMGVLVVVIVTTLNILTAFMSVDNAKIQLMRSFGANKMQIFWLLVLPASKSDIISTLKINVGLSWIGTIMGEYMACKAGIGNLLKYGGQIFDLDLVMSATLILCVMAALMYLLVAFIEKLVNKKN